MKARTRQSGFSMIELLIALSILAVGILAIAQLQVAAIHTLTLSRHMTAASQLASSEVEWLRTFPLPTDPAAAPLDGNGNPILDAAGKSVLLDNSNANLSVALGDGLASGWHELIGNPVNELGRHSRSTDMKYYVRWSIERCCGKDPRGRERDSNWNVVSKKLDVPGRGQVVIVMQVIWWESNKDKPATVDLQTLDYIALKALKGHMMELRSTRSNDI